MKKGKFMRLTEAQITRLAAAGYPTLGSQ